MRQQRLGAAEQGMGLAMPGRGVQAPTLGFELDSFQVQALAELGQNTVSPFNHADNAAAPGRITPRESGRSTPREANAAAPGRITPRESGRSTPREAGGSAFTPVPGVGINLPPPHLPGHDFLRAAGVTAGVNLGIRSTNATTSRQQTLVAAGGTGDSVVFPVGTRTRNPDQVDVLHLMNQQMTQGMAHLSSMMPSQDERRMAQLESAIASALQRMAQYKALGMDTSAISRRITALENELNGQMDAMFKL